MEVSYWNILTLFFKAITRLFQNIKPNYNKNKIINVNNAKKKLNKYKN
jgi:hypothetical protein